MTCASIKSGTACSVSKIISGGDRYVDDKAHSAQRIRHAIVTVIKNGGDEATLKNVWAKSSKAFREDLPMVSMQANGKPTMLGNGPSPPLCQLSERDVHINEGIAQAAQTSPRCHPDGVSRVDRLVDGLFGFIIAEPHSGVFIINNQIGFVFVPGFFELSTDALEAEAPGTVAPVETTATSSRLLAVMPLTEQQSSVASSSNAGLTAQSSRNGSVNQSPGSDSVTQNTGSGSTTQTATNSTGTVPDGSWPAIIKTGEVFDGKMQTFERSVVSCEGQTESI
ncbi:hypothetical protein PC121_g10169 [Phytophthora cactorum]|nr:hypothetical protein PC121_g10169 [Phytophthora cactorum]